jgi:serine/threonine protein kinase
MLKSGQILQERYQLKEQLGNSAGRQTWLAKDLAKPAEASLVGDQVIVKLLPFSPQMQWDDLKLFQREASVLKHLNHSRIPSYRDDFSLDKDAGGGLPWFGLVQDYIPGKSLQQLLKGGKRFTEAETQNIATQLLNILIYLHELSPAVLHRDIKPSNIIMGEDQQVYLVDFGAVQERAKTEGVTFTVVGTGGYAPPEQLWGKAVPASDIYALGATLIHLLTGTPPANLPQEKMRLQFKDKVSLTPRFANWIEKLCAPAPERRFSQARQALEALQANPFKETAGSGSLQNAPKVPSLRMGCLFIGGFAMSVMMGFLLFVTEFVASDDNDTASYRVLYSDEAIYYVKEINRNQTSYYQKNGVFADNLEQILPDPSKNGGIDLDISQFFCLTKASPEAAFNYCSAGEIAIRGEGGSSNYGRYIGGVFAVPGDVRTGEVLIADILCKANISDESDPAHPIVQGNRIQCGANTTRIDGWWPIVVGADLPEANRSDELVAAGEYERALQVAQTIKHPYFKAHSLAEIARSYAAAGKNSQAAEIFSLAETVAQTIQHSHSKDIALTDIARSYAIADRYEQALRVVSSIKDDNNRQKALEVIDRALEPIARLYAEKGQSEQALRVASSIKSDSDKDSALQAIARSYAEKGQYEQTLQVALSIKDDYKKDSALEAIARSYAEKGQYEQALRVASSIKSDSDKDSALAAIARSYAKKGQYEQAIRVASSIKSDSYKDSALAAIARYSVESINRAQQTYYSENSTFANSFTELGLNIPAKTGTYEYSVSTTATSAFTYATPLKKSSSAYIGGVFAVPNATGTQTETRAILCTNYSSSLQHLGPPTLQNGHLACPLDTTEVSPNSP